MSRRIILCIIFSLFFFSTDVSIAEVDEFKANVAAASLKPVKDGMVSKELLDRLYKEIEDIKEIEKKRDPINEFFKISEIRVLMFSLLDNTINLFYDIDSVLSVVVLNWDTLLPKVIWFSWVLGGILFLGLFFERISFQVFTIFRKRIARTCEGVTFPLIKSVIVMFVDSISILVFAIVAMMSLYFVNTINPYVMLRQLVEELISATILIQALLVLWRGILSPKIPNIRLLKVSNVVSKYLYKWGRNNIIFVLYGFFIANGILVLGLPTSIHTAITNFVIVIITYRLIRLVFKNKENVSNWIVKKGNVLSKSRFDLLTIFSRYWHIGALVYIFSFSGLLLTTGGGFSFTVLLSLYTALLFIVMTYLIVKVSSLCKKGFDILISTFPFAKPYIGSFVKISIIIAQASIFLITIFLVGNVWGVDLFSLLIGQTSKVVILTTINIFIIALIACILWELIDVFVNQVFSYFVKKQVISARARKHIKTLIPIFENILRAILVITITLAIISQFGIDIVPLMVIFGLFAGAFTLGAQHIVHDLITGVCTVLEDIFNKGDYVKIGDVEGVVDSISLRIVRVVDAQGNKHIIPFRDVKGIVKIPDKKFRK